MTLFSLGTAVPTPRGALSSPFTWICLCAVLALLPFAGLYPYFVMQALCFALVASAFNLLVGYGGLLSFGHAMFFGTAGYITAHSLKEWNISPELSLLLGTTAAGVVGVLSGAIAIRREGIYFSMITLAISQLLYFFYLSAPFTHGEDGIAGVPPGHLFGLFDLANTTTLYYVVLTGFMLGMMFLYRVVHSPFGEVLKSVRENELRAVSLGVKVGQFKLLAYVLSAVLAGYAGSMKVFVTQNASLTDVHWSMSGEIILITLIGGMGTIFGPVAGAFIIIAMQQYLAGFGQWVTVIHGATFIVCVLVFRRGLVGEMIHWQQRKRYRG